MKKKEKNGRNDYLVRVMLNLIYALKIFGHRSVESFRRELARNSQLRIVCGLSEGKYKYFKDRKHLVPPARVFTGLILTNGSQKFIISLNKIKNIKYDSDLHIELIGLNSKYILEIQNN